MTLLTTSASDTTQLAHPYDSSAVIYKYFFYYISNTCTFNYALVSNCIYVQGYNNVEMHHNTISDNSIPIYQYFGLTDYVASLLHLGLTDANFLAKSILAENKGHMGESSPVLIRHVS